jgi:hypothetical protein
MSDMPISGIDNLTPDMLVQVKRAIREIDEAMCRMMNGRNATNTTLDQMLTMVNCCLGDMANTVSEIMATYKHYVHFLYNGKGYDLILCPIAPLKVNAETYEKDLRLLQK